MQGSVGDCWFLSALAVIAERPDLILRLCPRLGLSDKGVVEIYLFLDGFWKSIIMDNFLPCVVDKKREQTVAKAVLAGASSSGGGSSSSGQGEFLGGSGIIGGGKAPVAGGEGGSNKRRRDDSPSKQEQNARLLKRRLEDGGKTSPADLHGGSPPANNTPAGRGGASTPNPSAYDPFAPSEQNLTEAADARDFLQTKIAAAAFSSIGGMNNDALNSNSALNPAPVMLKRKATVLDLAYSKANNYAVTK